MKWGQAPGLVAYSGDPSVSGDLEEGDYIRILTPTPNDDGTSSGVDTALCPLSYGGGPDHRPAPVTLYRRTRRATVSPRTLG